LFLSLADIFPAAPLTAALVSFSCRRLARSNARWIARFCRLSTPYLPSRSLNRTFLSLVDVLRAAPLTEWLIYFSCSHRRRTARWIARLFLLPTPCPPCRWLYRYFLSLAVALPVTSLAASHVSFCCWCNARRTAVPPCRLLYRSIFSPVYRLHAAALAESHLPTTPVVPLAVSVVLFSSGCHARRAARCVACFFVMLSSSPPRRSLHRPLRIAVYHLRAEPPAESLVSSPADDTPAAPLAASLICFSCRRLGRRAAHWNARFFLISVSYLLLRSLNRTLPSLVGGVLTAEPLDIQNIQKNKIKKVCTGIPSSSLTLSPPTHKWIAPEPDR
jgi:hypothetical protein